MASVEWERSGDRPPAALVEAVAAQEPRRSLTAPPAETRPLSEQKSERVIAHEHEPARVPPLHTAATPGDEDPVKRNGGADPYEATVERLFALLEENQVAIAALAQAWRHKSRALELAEAELAHTREAFAVERRIRRQA